MDSGMSDREPLLLREESGGVVTLTLNRPRHYNALSSAMLESMQAQLELLAGEDRARVVILAARGPAYCAGHDLKEMRDLRDKAEYRQLFDRCSRMMLTINRLPQPVIARVNGIATAAGCQLVANCDLAVAAESARFAVSGINVGLFCSTPAVALSRNLGRKKALEMLLTGEFIDAATACAYGLVNRVVADEELEAVTRSLANSIVAKPSLAVAIGKRMFYQQLGMPLEQAYAYASETMACNMDSNIAREGVNAFIEKRKPWWSPP